ncbi:UNVERIFIED_CONTAM: hypothetical protein Sradi_5636300 [Sesamum radiatum]|uniref:Reverse transcriptase zinc-binding domain-containing protein n=1 Tax=Sesamum radiatum TaxID=300843 RepID=A0AAW2L296_SESRA
MDKPWLQTLGHNVCAMPKDMQESHEHLFFLCPYATMCLRAIRRMVTLHWPYNIGPWSSGGHRCGGVENMWSVRRTEPFLLLWFTIYGGSAIFGYSSTPRGLQMR